MDRYAQVMVRCNQYSVPARFIGHRLRVKLSASTVTVFDRTTVVARHKRAAGKGVQVLELDHYLEILARKPGATGAQRVGSEHKRSTTTVVHIFGREDALDRDGLARLVGSTVAREPPGRLTLLRCWHHRRARQSRNRLG